MKANQKIRIILADDHPVVRSGLRMMIEADENLKVIAEADDGAEAFSLIKEHKPDVAVLDIDMPEKDGFTVARELQKERIDCEIIFLTMHDEKDIFLAAMDLGVKGYLLKDSAVRDIVKGIKSVVKGKSHITPSLASHLLNRRENVDEMSGKIPQLNDLTDGEKRILKMVSEYKTSKEIAE